MLAVIGRGIGQGRRAALVAVVGYALGDMIHTTFAVVGLSALIRASTRGFQVVNFSGSIGQWVYAKQAIAAPTFPTPIMPTLEGLIVIATILFVLPEVSTKRLTGFTTESL